MTNVNTVLVIGCRGQLGRSLQTLFAEQPLYRVTCVNRSALDLSQTAAIDHFFAERRFDVLINCAAYTAVDRAEQDTEQAATVNATAVEKLAAIARQQHSILIHVSTDYVFDGRTYRPYNEDSVVNPQNVYGATKLNGERAIQRIQPDAVILRTGWVYSEYGKNFVNTMLRLGQQQNAVDVVADQIGTPTYAADLAAAIVKVIEVCSRDVSFFRGGNKVHVYHYSNEGVCSWYDFAQTIFATTAMACRVNPIATEAYPTPAKRPFFSVLDKTKFKRQFGGPIPHWHESLTVCLSKLKRDRPE